MSYILVSGRDGQLGNELKDLASKQNFEFVFTDVNDLDITDERALKDAFEKYKPAFFINCAAYTAVDKAETNQEIAYKINAAYSLHQLIVGRCYFKCIILSFLLLHVYRKILSGFFIALQFHGIIYNTIRAIGKPV